ncbi:MAG: hypothetical protein WA459_21360 [Stellaceae bacterium]
MIRAAIALGFFLVISAGTAHAQTAPTAACTVSNVNILSQDLGDVTITCSGLSEAFGRQLADILTHILQDRLDPQMVMGKLDEVDQVPQEGIARTVSESQRQLIIQSLSGKPTGQISITAHPEVADSAEFAKGIATSLLQAGWVIEGQQIRRAAPPSLDPVPGLAVVVRDKNAPPRPALLVKAALNAAHITAALVADPTLDSGTVLVWVGRRPTFASATPAK